MCTNQHHGRLCIQDPFDCEFAGSVQGYGSRHPVQFVPGCEVVYSTWTGGIQVLGEFMETSREFLVDTINMRYSLQVAVIIDSFGPAYIVLINVTEFSRPNMTQARLSTLKYACL